MTDKKNKKKKKNNCCDSVFSGTGWTGSETDRERERAGERVSEGVKR